MDFRLKILPCGRIHELAFNYILTRLPYIFNDKEIWNQLPAEVLAPFYCILGSFRKRIRKVVTSKGTCRAD
jgi:hypothetical protein